MPSKTSQTLGSFTALAAIESLDELECSISKNVETLADMVHAMERGNSLEESIDMADFGRVVFVASYLKIYGETLHNAAEKLESVAFELHLRESDKVRERIAAYTSRDDG